MVSTACRCSVSAPQIESYQYTGDDTALNAIALLCSDEAGLHFAENVITSTQGPYGDWKGRVTCNQRPATPMYLAAFALQVEGPVGDGVLVQPIVLKKT